MRRFYGANTSKVAFAARGIFAEVGGAQDPIGIAGPHGGQLGGFAGGYRVSPRDLARLGLLVLEGGVWAGRRVLPADWVSAASRPQVPAGTVVNRDKWDEGAWNSGALSICLPYNTSGHPGRMGGTLGYGFSLWLLPDGEAFHMSGKMGNYVVVDPRHDLLVVVTNNATTHPVAAEYLAAVRASLRPGGTGGAARRGGFAVHGRQREGAKPPTPT